MPLFFYVAGVEQVALKRVKRKAITIEESVNARTVCKFTLNDKGTSYHPSVFDDVLVDDLSSIGTVRTTIGNSEVTRSTGPIWTSADVGKIIRIIGAGAGGSIYLGRIESFSDATHVDVFPLPSTSIIGAAAQWGDRLFAGTVTSVDENSIVDTVGTSLKVSAVDFNELPDRRIVTKAYTFPITLKGLLTELVANVLSTVGISLDAAQTEGPDMDPIIFENTSCTDILNTLSKITGFVWSIDRFKRLLMKPTTTTAAPVNLTNANSQIKIGATRKVTRKDYRNTQIVLIGSGTEDKTETFPGNGTRNYPLTYLIGTRPAGVIVNGVTQSIGNLGDTGFQWYTDIGNNRLVQDSGQPLLTGSDTISVTYTARFPMAVIETLPSEISARGIYDNLVKAPEIMDVATGRSYAQGLLRQYGFEPNRATLQTEIAGYRAAMTVTITLPEREMSGTHFINAVRRIDQGAADEARWRYELDVVSGTDYPGYWLDYYKQLAAGGASASSVSGGSVTGGGGGGGGGTGGAAVALLRAPMGGAQFQFVQWDGTGDGWIDIAEFIDISLIKEQVAGTIFVRVHLRTSNAGCTVTPRLFNVSANVAAGTGTATSFIGTAPKNFLDFQYQGFTAYLSPGEQVYRVQVRPSLANTPVFCARATIENRF
jgi:hypothetical protein